MTISMFDFVFSIWEEWIYHAGGQPNNMLFESLTRLYEGRPYHNMDHIEYCLKEFGRLLTERMGHHPFENEAAAALAIIYHDAIQYVGVRGANETLSAQVADIHCHEMGLSEKDIVTIKRNILATKHDRPAPSHDAALVADIDLAVLAENPVKYNAYVAAIRQEYISPRGDFASGRKEFLRHMLTRSKIYQTSEFSPREDNARLNMLNEFANYGAKVAVGGTFDILHEGHKELLRQAFQTAGSGGKVCIGLTVDQMATKKHPVQSYQERKENIESWIYKQPWIPVPYFDISPLKDAFGPTLDEGFDVLVASEESRGGAEEVNRQRDLRGLTLVPLRIIPVVERGGVRVSSTVLRSGELR